MKKHTFDSAIKTGISNKLAGNSFLLPMIASLIGVFISFGCSGQLNPPGNKTNVKVGTYYFDGWAGKNKLADDPNEPWAKNAPTHLTKRFVRDFSDREPVWGWRDDTREIMERQIDLAADNGLDFFLFCWYWKDNKGPINVPAIKKKTISIQVWNCIRPQNVRTA